MSTTNAQALKALKAVDDYSGDVQIKRPISLSPWSKREENKSGSVWISMKPKKILDQYSKGAGAFDTAETGVEFLFLAPLALNENIVHRWDAYESVASRLAQKARSIVKLGAEANALIDVGGKYLTDENARSKLKKAAANEGATVEDFMTTAYNSVVGSRIPRIKIDTPLYYTNSERRQIIFEFQLFNESVPGYSPDKVLLDPIQKLMKYSSPSQVNDGNIKINFPYMWEVKTLPQQFIKYSTCALIGVQPTWNSPYINGYPSSCNLQLTFQDLSPLYANTIEKGTIINVKSGSVKNSIQNDTNAANKTKKKLQPRIIRAGQTTGFGV